MDLADIDPGWLEVILTGIGLAVSLILGYQLGRRDPIEACVTLSRHQALDLVRVYHRSVASDVVRCLRRSVQRIEERGRQPTEASFGRRSQLDHQLRRHERETVGRCGKQLKSSPLL